ncbi:MAG: SpoIIE family protein phosphatase [Terracidiphilus sp.]
MDLSRLLRLKDRTAGEWRRTAWALAGAVVFSACSALAAGQKPQSAPAAATAPPAALQTSAVVTLNGPWKFQQGDDPRWADPNFDDTDWLSVTLAAPLASQGVESYTGYGWYRLRLDAALLNGLTSQTPGKPLMLLAAPNSVGQLAVYIDGVEVGRTRGMTSQPVEYRSSPVEARLEGAARTHVLAIRSWAGPQVPIRIGLLARVELGGAAGIDERMRQATSRQWNEGVLAPLLVSFFFLCVAGLGLALFLAQRHHVEYLWLTLLCLAVDGEGAGDVAYSLGRLPLGVYDQAELWTGHAFMAVTLEFVLRFTRSPFRRTVRAVQIAVLALPLGWYLLPSSVYGAASVTAQVVFCGLVCFLLLGAWRHGRREAGVMLLPFVFAALAGSTDSVLNYFAALRWLPRRISVQDFYLGPIHYDIGAVAYLILLVSLVAVILYRFIRVSQEEQRSSAEVAAARSVQALLIPTDLPSNEHFLLESAYIPVNGVGGDFFQVLPLADESLLIVVGDVSGKGLQAAMSSSTLVGALRNELAHEPATILDHLNRVLLGAGRSAKAGKDAAPSFATCMCARIHPDGRLILANAGHLSPYRDGRELEMMPSLPLGVIAEAGYEQKTFRLNRGDRLVFLSDGVVEATDAHGEIFGFERTQQVSNEPALYIAQTAKHFGQTDDITVVSLYLASRRAPEAGPVEDA